MSRRRLSVLFCAAWLASSAALAQPQGQPPSAPPVKDAPPSTVSPVTVHTPLTPQVIQKQSNSFVQAYAGTANPNIDQISRWRDPVCAEIWGLPLASQAAKIKARIARMAEAVGLPAALAGCKPNVEIVFTDQPQTLLDTVAQRWEPLLGYYHRSRTNQLKTVTHPIQAWYVTATESDGVNAAELMFSNLPLSLIPPSSRIADDPTNPPPLGCVHRMTACYRSELANVLIVADSKALEGMTLSLVADDIVMLALSQPKSLDGCNILPSVIDRFAKSACPGRDPPGGLTPADAAYLTALYSADTKGKKSVEYAAIGERMAQILIKANAVAATGAQSADAKTP
jgi:hypothetical protein